MMFDSIACFVKAVELFSIFFDEYTGRKYVYSWAFLNFIILIYIVRLIRFKNLDF